MKSNDKSTTGDDRREYRKPVLVRYGDLGRITRDNLGGSGNLDDTGNQPPFTFKSGV